jgi:AraC family transcriptional regulator of adaptative response/methylated-DNA-[protein]-cysteine methyltransferase
MTAHSHTASVADLGTYALVASAIHYLQGNVQRQPSLAELAVHLGVSESRLQRSFSAFAGVSPKRFLQFHTKQHAKALLLDSADVLTTALAAGLSGPGRLHDLMVSTEAMTPGEIGRGGRGVVLRYAYGDTPLGAALAACTPRGLSYLGFAEPHGEAEAMQDLHDRWPAATLEQDDSVRAVITQAFAGWGSGKPLHLVLAGTNFQIKVWEALLAIPPGQLVSYDDIAAVIGLEHVRAIENAANALRACFLELTHADAERAVLQCVHSVAAHGARIVSDRTETRRVSVLTEDAVKLTDLCAQCQ